jgi:hypothetical protein
MAQPGSAGLLAGQSGDAQGKTAPTRRGTELSMLAFAAGLVTAALMLVEANQNESLTIRILWYGLAYLALFGIAHAAVRQEVLLRRSQRAGHHGHRDGGGGGVTLEHAHEVDGQRQRGVHEDHVHGDAPGQAERLVRARREVPLEVVPPEEGVPELRVDGAGRADEGRRHGRGV